MCGRRSPGTRVTEAQQTLAKTCVFGTPFRFTTHDDNLHTTTIRIVAGGRRQTSDGGQARRASPASSTGGQCRRRATHACPRFRPRRNFFFYFFFYFIRVPIYSEHFLFPLFLPIRNTFYSQAGTKKKAQTKNSTKKLTNNKSFQMFPNSLCTFSNPSKSFLP